MGFLGVYRALYDYVPQAQGELAIQEGDVLYVLEKDGGDGWWKAKKKAGAEDEEEPEGLVPHNYVDQAPAVCHARALYEYTRQTDEELSFPEDALLEVFDTSDPDWILVGLDDEFGFVPANYIEMSEALGDHAATPATPALPARPASIPSAPSGASEAVNAAAPPAAAALASVLAGRAAGAPDSPVSPPAMPSRSRSIHDERVSDDESLRSPALPSRPRPSAEPSHTRYEAPVEEEPSAEVRRAPGGFHMYNINEMVSVMGKRKKMPTTLGINLGTGVILIAPERASDGPSQEWTADRMTHYSREGKHVFMELVRPSKSVDFHAGAKDTAEEIVAALGEMAGAVRAEGLKEVIMAGTQSGKKRGQVLYDFMAQGEDEVTVAIGDEVIVVDDSKSEEWWQVRRIKNGKEGVVPSSYIEITGVTSPAPAQAPSSSTTTRSTVEQNRLEEVRLTKEALKASKEPQEVGPGMTLPERGSSLSAREHGNDFSQQRSRRENGRGEGANKSKSKPDSSKVRTWTDRSRSFSVEAQFLGLKDGKIHLHKMNGVKIAVPITKMSREDLEYIENATGISLEDEKPLADVKKSRPSGKVEKTPSPDRGGPSGAAVDKKPEYDWFQFFLDCDVAVGLCERYAQAFIKDSMDESVLPDVDGNVLRQLGLREGDIIKVMRHLDNRYGRNKRSGEGESESGGLFSGPGGALRNNTRKGRPAPAVQTSDVVDAKAFSSKDAADEPKTEPKSPPAVAKPTNGVSSKAASSGFDDDAWDVKPSKQQLPARAVSASPSTSGPSAPPQQPALTGSMQELSLLTAPLQPSRTEPSQAMTNNTAPTMDQTQPPAPQQPEGATPSFFSSVSPQQAARQRPQPPQTSPLQGGLVPPPPRPLSAPQSAQPSAYAAPPQMAPQMTGALQGRPAPPGQSLNDLTQARLQQQYLATMQQQQQQQPMMTGYMGQQMQPLNPMYTGAPTQFMQPMMTGSVGPSPFADPGRPGQFSPMQSQPTGFQPSFTGAQPGFPQQAPPGSINSYLPPALEPQRTGMPGIQPQPTGMSTFSQQSAPQPLQPQKTGPAPPVRFGVPADANKLTPQATGRRANLSQATPQNPFGF